MLAWVTACLVLARLAHVASSLEVQIHPESIRDAFKDPISVQCSTERAKPIAACQFGLWFVGDRPEGVLLDATHADKVTVGTSSKDSFEASFTKNFQAGWCEVSLQGVSGNAFLVGCKLTTANETAFRTMSVFLTGKIYTELSLEEYNQQSLVSAGGNVSILVKTNPTYKWLNNCTTTLPNNSKLEILPGRFRTSTNVLTPASGSRNKVSGGRLADGECGFTINGVQDSDNGVFFVLAENDRHQAAKAVTVIVRKPPSGVRVSLDAEPEGWVAGDSLTATCAVMGVRQPDELNWTWTLGNRTLRHEHKGYWSPNWCWPWEEGDVSQRLTLTLAEGDDGLELGCQVLGLHHSVLIGFAGQTAALKKGRQLMSKVTAATITMLLVVFVVTAVAVAAVRRRGCFAGPRYSDLKAQTHGADHLRRARPARAATQDEHPSNGRRPNQRRPVAGQGRRAAGEASKATAPTARTAQGQARPKQAVKGGGHKALAGQGRTPRGELPEVQYANAKVIGNRAKADDKDVEYLNVAHARVAAQKNLPGTSPKMVQKEHGKPKASVDPAQRKQPPAQGQQALATATRGSYPRATAAVRPMPRAAVVSQGSPSIRGKEAVDKVEYAELRLPAVRRTAPAAPTAMEPEVDYAELDWS